MENKKIMVKVGAVALAALMIGGIIGGEIGYTLGRNHSIATGVGGGMVVTIPENDIISLNTTKLSDVEYESNGISPLAETAYTITATVTPANANNAVLDWSVAWQNADEWSNGKTVTDYVTVTTTDDDGLIANVECLQAFGTPIIITVSIRSNPSVYATVAVDYARSVTGITATATGTGGDIVLCADSSWDSQNADVYLSADCVSSSSLSSDYTYHYTYSTVYTIEDTFTLSVTGGVNSYYISELQTYAATNTYYLNDTGVKSIVDTFGTSGVYSFGLIDFTNINASFGVISSGYRNYFNTSSINSFLALMAGFHSSENGVAWRYPIYCLTFEVTGTYSSYTGYCSVGYVDGAFGTAATGIMLDPTEIVFA